MSRSSEISVALFDQSSLVYEPLCTSIYTKPKDRHKVKAKNMLSSKKNEVLVVLDVEEPEWMSTEDVDIPPLDSCEVIV